MRRILLAILLNLSLITCAAADEDIASVWHGLFSRCRVSVETDQGFDATGLRDLGRDVVTTQQVTVQGLPYPVHPSYKFAVQRWETDGKRFVVVERENPPDKHGKVTRTCDIEIGSKVRSISPAEEKALKAAFMAERKNLFNTGRYEHWDPDAIFSTNLGIRLAGKNPRNCRVVSYLMIETRPDAMPFLRLGTGEQAYDCGGEPRLSHHP